MNKLIDLNNLSLFLTKVKSLLEKKTTNVTPDRLEGIWKGNIDDFDNLEEKPTNVIYFIETPNTLQ